jgi:alkaline phosphatase
MAGMAAAVALGGCGDNQRAATDAGARVDADPAKPPRIAILVIGDGMGPGQLAAASLTAHGAEGRLFLQSLPMRGKLNTASLSGTTDSCAAATAMATGVSTINYVCGEDRDTLPVENLVERAHALGLSAGVVTTAAVTDATPAGFTAHRYSRVLQAEIAEDQVRVSKPDVLLGGGADAYLPMGPGSIRKDDGLLDDLAGEGVVVVRAASELAALSPTPGRRLTGLFAPHHLEYSIDRAADTREPRLRDLALAAVRQLDTDPEGFFLMVEGARIDMASHANDAPRAIGEVLELDATVRALVDWTKTRPDADITLLVIADHETGGLTVTGLPPAPGEPPPVAWRWGSHTNTRVDVHGLGARAAVFAGEVRDHRVVHAVLDATLSGRDVTPPAPALIPDGDLRDLDHLAARQQVKTSFGAGLNQLDALYLDADEDVLAIGIEGLFEWDRNAVVVLVDVDYGTGTGADRLADALADKLGRADAILTGSSLGPPNLPGFGADFAIVVFGGGDPKLDQLDDAAGVRGMFPPIGAPNNLSWYGAATNFYDGTRTRGQLGPGATITAGGWEAHVPWTTLYPALAGRVPKGATIAVAAVLVNDDGGYTSNQALPSFPAAMTQSPGRSETPLPGVVVFTVDGDADGRADGSEPTTIQTGP